MKKILIFILGVVITFFSSCKESPTQITDIKGNIELISPQQVYDAIYKDRSIQLVDVRTPEEFKGNHLKGAQNICVTSDDFKEKVYKTGIPRNVRLSEAPSHGVPVLVYDKNCPGSRSYYSFTDEFINQESKVGSAA